MEHPMFSFAINKVDGRAREGTLHVNGTQIPTPVFMPVGTNATVKAMMPRDVEEIGARIILANTYHLVLRPGADVVERLGGVKRFSGWKHAVLTDSGGFQVFSLSRMNKVTDEGVSFQSHIDGARHFFTPSRAIAYQHSIGADLIMAFDECIPHDATYDYAKTAMDRTTRWAKECLTYHREQENSAWQYLGAIVQGGMFKDLRKVSAESLVALDTPFYAIGGLSVGEGPDMMHDVLGDTTEHLPRNKPRYLMGVGEVRDILNAVLEGVDMFDCVMPTRNARNGEAFTFDGVIKLRNSAYKEDASPVEAGCPCYACRTFSKAYLRHLDKAREILFPMLLTVHNLTFMERFMDEVRKAIREGRFTAFRDTFLARFYHA